MMKFTALLLVALVAGANAAAAPAPAPGGPLTIGKWVDSLCPEIKKVLTGGDYKTLLAILDVLKDAPVVLPEGAEGVWVAAPNDKAFDAALKALGVTPAQALAAPDLLATVVKEHVITSVDGKYVTLAGTPVDVTAKTIDVEGSLAPVNIDATVKCPDGKTTAFAVDSVIVPGSIIPKPAPAPPPAGPKPVPGPLAPKPAPKPMAPKPAGPAAAPPSSAASATFTVAAGVAMVAGFMA